MKEAIKMAIAAAVLFAVLTSSTPSVILASTNDTLLIEENTFVNNGTINSSNSSITSKIPLHQIK
jgi:DNA topoisomerase VI subunit B